MATLKNCAVPTSPFFLLASRLSLDPRKIRPQDGNYLGRTTELPSLLPRLGGINAKSQSQLTLLDTGDAVVMVAWWTGFFGTNRILSGVYQAYDIFFVLKYTLW